MEAIDIVFIILGLGCVVISFFLSEKLGGGRKQDELLQEFRQKFQQKLLEKDNLELLFADAKLEFAERMGEDTEECVEKAKEELSRVSNEKTMAFAEYSDQVLEKIHQDHTEVVFLYDMLNEKESSLKDFAARLEGNRKRLEELMAEAKVVEQRIAEKRVQVGELLEADVNATGNRAGGGRYATGRQAGGRNGNDRNAIDRHGNNKYANDRHSIDRPDREAAGSNGDLQEAGSARQREALKAGGRRGGSAAAGEAQAGVRTPVAMRSGTQSDRNEQILTLHGEGKSIVEISKMLGLGQGEVKLVIDLYQGAK